MTRMLPTVMPTKPMAMIGGRDERLRIKSQALDLNDPKVNAQTSMLASRMLATLMRTPVPGLALTAPQVGVNVRLVVTNQGVAYCNPIVAVQAEHDGIETAIEGCLSFPGRMYAVPRARHIKLTVQTLDLQWHVDEHTDLAARMWQHEVDHLDGIIIADVWPETTPRATPLPTGAAERLGMHAAERDPGALNRRDAR